MPHERKKLFYAYYFDDENDTGLIDKTKTKEQRAQEAADKAERYKTNPPVPKYDILTSWGEVYKIVAGTRARYKGFFTYEDAQIWIQDGGKYMHPEDRLVANAKYLKDGVYFDSGTGRGEGTEVRITDKYGKCLLTKNMSKFGLNQWGNVPIGERTNNFGETLGLCLALRYALENGITRVFGDSRMAIMFWSKGRYHKQNLNPETVELIEECMSLRKKFEARGGSISHIRGGVNPADIGFHRD